MQVGSSFIHLVTQKTPVQTELKTDTLLKSYSNSKENVSLFLVVSASCQTQSDVCRLEMERDWEGVLYSGHVASTDIR
jgi:hypothetical protein